VEIYLKGSEMSITVYINYGTKNIIVHKDECSHLIKEHNCTSVYSYFETYDEASEWVNNHLDAYECENCNVCNPQNYS